MKFLVYTIFVRPDASSNKNANMWPTPTWGIHFSDNLLCDSVCNDITMQTKCCRSTHI